VVRVLACVLFALAVSPAAAAPPSAACPGIGAGLAYASGGKEHVVALVSCTDRITGRARVGFPAAPGVRTTGGSPAVQRLYVHGRLVFTHWETGPLVPLRVSGDGRWVFFFVDEFGGQSSIADGTPLYVVSTRGGAVHDLGEMLPYPDYLTWCGGELVYTPGTDRVAIDGKHLVAAAPPDWTPRPLWDDPARTFGSPTCEPGRSAVAVLSQRTSRVANFFATRWRLWRIGLDGSRRLLDVPPPGWADEQPTWSPDGNALAFVRERNGYGRLMLRRNRSLFGPLARLPYALGYYGHHDWGLAWRR
jgi:WD40-like Beta Propeller Repeat